MERILFGEVLERILEQSQTAKQPGDAFEFEVVAGLSPLDERPQPADWPAGWKLPTA